MYSDDGAEILVICFAGQMLGSVEPLAQAQELRACSIACVLERCMNDC